MFDMYLCYAPWIFTNFAFLADAYRTCDAYVCSHYCIDDVARYVSGTGSSTDIDTSEPGDIDDDNDYDIDYSDDDDDVDDDYDNNDDGDDDDNERAMVTITQSSETSSPK